jgi:hypothetical protein
MGNNPEAKMFTDTFIANTIPFAINYKEAAWLV